MGILEIVLLAAGAVIFIVSFCIPVKEEKLKEETRNLAAQEVKNLVTEELENVRGRLSELSEEEVKEQIARSGRTMERISNEKIMAVNEYSDTVLEEIHKNHEEVVFLYDMLKHKKESLSESYGKADQHLQELLQQVKDSEITVKERLTEISEKVTELDEMKAQEPQREAAIPPVQTEAAAESGFQLFVPEKVEVVPKKRTRPKRTVNKPKSEPQEELPAENRDVMLLLSGSMEGEEAANNSNMRILELHKAGKSNMAIARELGLGIGEVQLVIDLYNGFN